MKILISATYFEPYSSGLSQYALRLARGLVSLGHEVKVLTSQFNPTLSLEEEIDGVQIVRVKVDFHYSKGVIMFGLKEIAEELITWADVVNLHLPQFESATLTRVAKDKRKWLVVTYHCDLDKKGGLLTRIPYLVTNQVNKIALAQADLIAQSSVDYASSSQLLAGFMDKVRVVVPPINLLPADDRCIERIRLKYGLDGSQKLIGLSGRVASEKGYETVVKALPAIVKRHPNALVVHAGAWKGVVGEEIYQGEIDAMIKQQPGRWKKLGFLPDNEFRAFFSICDLLVVSSTNRTEAFGMVQIESFAQGTPVVASDSPGIRVPVTETGMGALFNAGDPASLAEKVNEVLDRGKTSFQVSPDYLRDYSEKNVALKYMNLFRE